MLFMLLKPAESQIPLFYKESRLIFMLLYAVVLILLIIFLILKSKAIYVLFERKVSFKLHNFEDKIFCAHV